MAAGLRDQSTGASTAADVTATLTGVQAGDLLVGCLYERDGATISAFGDDINGPWTLILSRAATAARVAMYYFANSQAGNPLVTVTLGGTSPRDINVQAWSGMPTNVTPDTSAQNGNTAATSHAHGSITPSAASLVVSCLGLGNDHGGMTDHTLFTALDTDAGVTNAGRRYFSYKVAHTGAVNVTPVSVNSQNSDAIVAAFVESTGGPANDAKIIIRPT